MNRSYFSYIKQQSTRYLFTHLVISIYSYLILVCWGLPFTPLSFLGNLIFNPILVLFLGLSTIIFFCSLCFIPATPFIFLLEQLSHAWLYILSLGATYNLNITCPKPPYLVIAIVGLSALIIIAQQISLFKKNLLLILLIACSLWTMKQTPAPTGFKEVPCARGNIYIISSARALIMIDPGYLGQYASASDFVEYTLMPFLTKEYGTTHIDHLILLQPSQTLFEAVKKFLEKGTIKHIYIPLWKGQASKKMLYQFMRMKELAQTKRCIIHRLGNNALNIACYEPSIAINALESTLTYAAITYKAFVVTGSIDKKKFTLYPAKYTHQN